ncbi:MAG TPA: formate--tetrahydrofolate ligase [Verrucomicrobiae bacterium]|nr:formate--tetrahydrofolate ligase [Verrucomicrobiae bacterium]
MNADNPRNRIDKPIGEIAASAGLAGDELILYGQTKAKVRLETWERLKNKPDGKLILVTGITPTPAGEGKTTVAIGMADALRRLGKKSLVTLREPSLGPVFGMKGGATGGGKAKVIPEDEINLHFTGDFHAVTAAHNLLSALLDNHLHHGNVLDFDMRRTIWKRALDVNDRALRRIVVGLGGREGSYPREDRFDITAASELMAILSLAKSREELKERIANIIVGFTRTGGAPIRASELNGAGGMAALLRDALAPNLVQTAEGTPAFVHCGPFANIAHGCNSILATRFALKLGDFVLTEAGFGSDLGGEKFLDIFCPSGGFKPAAAVLVATVRALKFHGGCKRSELDKENTEAVERGFSNLVHHLGILGTFGLPALVAINRFTSDTEAELKVVEHRLADMNQPTARCEAFAMGSEGAVEAAEQLAKLVETQKSDYHPLYTAEMPLAEKIETVATHIYGADGVHYSGRSARQLEECAEMGFGNNFVCIAKTPYSFGDDPKKGHQPAKHKITIREVRLLGGAGFVVPIAGEILTMPGLPKVPAAEQIDLLPDGTIANLV